MLIYEYRIRDEFDRVRDYAVRLSKAFDAERDPKELLMDVAYLEALFNEMIKLLPPEIGNMSAFGRRIHWLNYWLEKGDRLSCVGDVHDIINIDLPELETRFRNWVIKSEFYDQELVNEVSDLVIRQEYDSAVRKAFVVLRKRIVDHFDINDEIIDGEDLVNKIFGSNPNILLRINKSKRAAWRNLLAGLFSLFRNPYAHKELSAEWHEADAVLSTINYTLKSLERIAPKGK